MTVTDIEPVYVTRDIVCKMEADTQPFPNREFQENRRVLNSSTLTTWSQDSPVPFELS